MQVLLRSKLPLEQLVHTDKDEQARQKGMEVLQSWHPDPAANM